MFYIFWTKSNSDQSIKKYTVFAQYYFPSSKKGNTRCFCNPVYTGFLVYEGLRALKKPRV